VRFVRSSKYCLDCAPRAAVAEMQQSDERAALPEAGYGARSLIFKKKSRKSMFSTSVANMMQHPRKTPAACILRAPEAAHTAGHPARAGGLIESRNGLGPEEDSVEGLGEHVAGAEGCPHWGGSRKEGRRRARGVTFGGR
jgi:hypothetical protein